MNILVNASNLKLGGAIQVADSIFKELYTYKNHRFIIVYSKVLTNCAKSISGYENIEVIEYETPLSIWTVLTGCDHFLDKLIKNKQINAVLTIFGPSRWRPKVPHLSGFAQGHLVLLDSPFWDIIHWKTRIKLRIKLSWIKFSLEKSANYYYTENEIISERLQKIFPRKTVFTVTNSVNQVFYHSQQWDKSLKIPCFDGLTLLTVAANYPHKNLSIIVPTCKYLEEHFPSFKFRFILTIHENELQGLDDCSRRHIVFIGPVKIQQVPYLYEQSDIMLLPSLLECFSASYVEAMVMGKPILTTDLAFARGLCGNAAYYYDAISFKALGNAIKALFEDSHLQIQLIQNGKEQIKKFDTYEERLKKLIRIVESIA